jgi:hypothetical protein
VALDFVMTTATAADADAALVAVSRRAETGGRGRLVFAAVARFSPESATASRWRH